MTIPAEPAQTEPRSAQLTWPVPTLPILYLGYHIPAADPTIPTPPPWASWRRRSSARRARSTERSSSRSRRWSCSQADAEAKRDPGLFTIVARVRKPEDVAEVRQADRVGPGRGGQDADRRGAARRDQGPPPLRVRRLARQRRRRGHGRRPVDRHRPAGPTSMNDLYAAYDRLTPADLQRVAATYFAPTNETVVTLESEDSQ